MLFGKMWWRTSKFFENKSLGSVSGGKCVSLETNDLNFEWKNKQIKKDKNKSVRFSARKRKKIKKKKEKQQFGKWHHLLLENVGSAWKLNCIRHWIASTFCNQSNGKYIYVCHRPFSSADRSFGKLYDGGRRTLNSPLVKTWQK